MMRVASTRLIPLQNLASLPRAAAVSQFPAASTRFYNNTARPATARLASGTLRPVALLPSTFTCALSPLPRPANSRTMASSSATAGKRLAGKTILITGASSGIGRSCALEFARTCPQDLRLILTARRVDVLKEIAADIKKEVGDGVKVLPVKMDISKGDEVRSFVGNLPEEWRDIHILLNNA